MNSLQQTVATPQLVPAAIVRVIPNQSSRSYVAWSAPVAKTNPLVIKKRTADVTEPMSRAETHATVTQVSAFPAPAQVEAFTVPRPVILEPMSPWGQPVEKVDFLALRRSALVRTTHEFSRPPLRAVRSPDPLVGLPFLPC